MSPTRSCGLCHTLVFPHLAVGCARNSSSFRCVGNSSFPGVTVWCARILSSFICAGNSCFLGVIVWCAGNSCIPSGVLVIPVFLV